MSAPGFGYSAGDFIAAATLIAKVTRSLKDAGGAREEYQALVEELDLLHQTLAQLQPNPQSSSSDSDRNHVSASFARTQTKVTISELTRFLQTISKFDSSMGEASRSGWYRGIPRKAQWAIHYASEVEKMRAKLGTQLQMILVARSVHRDQFFRDQQTQSASTERPNNATQDEIQTMVRHECLPKINQILYKLEHIEARDAKSSSDSRNTVLLMEAEKRASQDGINSKEWLQTAQESSSNLEGSQAQKSHLSTTKEDDVKHLLIALLTAMTKSAQQLLLSLWMFLPETAVILQTTRLMLLYHEPLLAAADCINFEDMIGRKFSLDYQYYKHWKHFESFLSQKFRNHPGQRHVSQRQFVLNSGTTVVSGKTWLQIMKPGAKLDMAGLLLSWETVGKKCPRPGCSGKGSKDTSRYLYECSKCKLIYACSRSPRSGTEIPTALDEVNLLQPEPGLRVDDDTKHFRRILVRFTQAAGVPMAETQPPATSKARDVVTSLLGQDEPPKSNGPSRSNRGSPSEAALRREIIYWKSKVGDFEEILDLRTRRMQAYEDILKGRGII